MKEKTDPDKIAALERAIAKKYGKEAIANPEAYWDDEKEATYLEQLKIIEKRLSDIEESLDKVKINGVFVSKKLFNKETASRTCSLCETYSFDKRDDVYMRKFKVCFKCYIETIED